MAIQTGRLSTYEVTVGLKLDMEDAIYMIDPFDVPLLGTYGAAKGSVLGSEDTTSTKIEWLEDELVPASDQLNGAVTTGDTVFTVDNRDRFKTNDMLRLDDEFVRITGYGTTANTLLISRAWGSTAVNHADNTIALILGTLPQEGDDPVDGLSTQRTALFNYTQIYQDQVEVTRSEEKEAKYGVNSEASYQMGKRLREGAIKLERNLILGVRNEDTSGKRRSHGGLDYFITTGVDSTTTTITEALWLDQMQNSFGRGGNVDLLIVGGTQKRKISAFDRSAIVLSHDDNVRGAVVEYLDSDFGRVYIVLDRWVPVRFLFGIEKQYVSMVWFDRWFSEPLAKTGDRQEWQIVGEGSMKVRNQKAHFKFTALT